MHHFWGCTPSEKVFTPWKWTNVPWKGTILKKEMSSSNPQVSGDMLVFHYFHHYVRCHFLPRQGDEKPFTSGEVTMSKICLTPQALPDELEIWPIGLVRLRIYSKDTWAWRLDAKYFKNSSKVFFVIIWSLKIKKMVIHWWFGSLFDISLLEVLVQLELHFRCITYPC